jgi:hypothetical protein
MTGIEPSYSSNRCGIRTSGVVEVIGSVVADFPGCAHIRCYRKCCGHCRQEDRNRPSLKSGTYPSGDVYRVIGCADFCATCNATSPGPRNAIENAQLLDGSTSRQWGQKWSVTTPGPMSLTRPTPLVLLAEWTYSERALFLQLGEGPIDIRRRLVLAAGPNRAPTGSSRRPDRGIRRLSCTSSA